MYIYHKLVIFLFAMLFEMPVYHLIEQKNYLLKNLANM